MTDVKMQRIILHWSAGSNSVGQSDMDHYHYIVDGNGRTFAGRYAVKDNANTADGKYAAHTKNCNTGAIGIAMAGMFNAVESPFHPGPFPLNAAQLDVFVKLAAELARKHGVPVTRTTVLTHAEVQPTLGIAQRGKWDITWLPGMKKPGKPVEVGDDLRAMILEHF